ncbi:low-specificity L-threonine aldolase 1 [Populus alba x Populus x berolinensis]|uniref:Low-specificity L-threonine aldolase 1 n=1 Tax=Populus alba x Populus x berolinensis TaxID=444605 RepID=A0AAD6PN37_9ROSI|nr:low-specificity L-threonine aldolase 1 [Populus alba x Populus x berolinensis]
MVTRTVDLRSDTVTKPTEAMRAAMANAEVDDDVLSYDPSALRGSEVILGNNSHIHIYENGGISTIGGVHPRTVKNNDDGTMDIDLIEAAIRDPRGEIVYPTTRLICLENTQAKELNDCITADRSCTLPNFELKKSGVNFTLIPSYARRAASATVDEYTDKVGELAKKHGLKLHIDGARIFNASIALGVPVHRLLQAADSASVCLSKGVGAPVGSVIVGSKSFIAKARILRKTLGGGMRQVGILCAAALVALHENVPKLGDDHKKAKMLAEGLNQIKGLRLNVAAVETNIIFFDVVEGAKITAEKLCKNLEQHGILVMQESLVRIRVVLHHQISESDVQYTLSCFKQALAGRVQEENGN